MTREIKPWSTSRANWEEFVGRMEQSRVLVRNECQTHSEVFSPHGPSSRSLLSWGPARLVLCHRRWGGRIRKRTVNPEPRSLTFKPQVRNPRASSSAATMTMIVAVIQQLAQEQLW